jgi:flagellar biosynthesis chaperone FliJ
MLKPLATLIKINKAQIDEKRKALAVLLDSKQQRLREIKKMEDSILFEADNLKNIQEDFRPQFLYYIEAIRLKEAIILEEIDNINPQIEKTSEEIAEIFSEMKKFEIVKDNREAELEAELIRKTQIDIDEIAMMNFMRRKPDEYTNNTI